ncbi:unnamed protein product [Rhodiola kirilowii]
MEDDDAIPLPRPRTPHIKKRALKNKALTVSFNEKDLRDYVTGFHKRKKKRRKEAEQQQQEALRRKRIELRKKRKLEKEAVYGGGGPSNDADENEEVADGEDDEDLPKESISETKTYESGDIQVTVTTSEISREEEDHLASQKRQLTAPVSAGESTQKPKIPVKNKKPFKRVSKPKSSKTHKKRDKSKSSKRDKRRK